MEPASPLAARVPSARTIAAWRRRASERTVPGRKRPASMIEVKATRGSARLPVMTVSSALPSGSTASMRAVAASI